MIDPNFMDRCKEQLVGLLTSQPRFDVTTLSKTEFEAVAGPFCGDTGDPLKNALHAMALETLEELYWSKNGPA